MFLDTLCMHAYIYIFQGRRSVLSFISKKSSANIRNKKTPLRKLKKPQTELSVFPIYVSDTGLISQIYKELKIQQYENNSI